jgi:hypothetical protein
LDLDTAAPTASVTTASIMNTATVTTAQSTETGTVYLVLDSANITSVVNAELEVTNSTGKKATVATANTNTTIVTADLADGTYKVIAVDAAGNVSGESTGTIANNTSGTYNTSATYNATAHTVTFVFNVAAEDPSHILLTYDYTDVVGNAYFSELITYDGSSWW